MPANVIVETAGLIFAFAYGLLGRRSILAFSVFIGLAMDFVGEFLLNRGGPTVCLAFVFFPLYALICCFIGKGLRSLLGKAYRTWINPEWKSEGKPPFCATCGYSLYINFSERCPECGSPTANNLTHSDSA
jgi:hypothetical protein